MALSLSSAIGVGFGTAALGDQCHAVVTMALEAGFRKFDTAEADWWYDQRSTGEALRDFFAAKNGENNNDECYDADGQVCSGGMTCGSEDFRISTKIPPWSLTDEKHIRELAANSRRELVGFCEDEIIVNDRGEMVDSRPFSLDVYYIHAPKCWDGWHPRCKNAPPPLNLRDAWVALEAVVGIDHSARRIGLSNVWPDDLLDIIRFVRERQAAGHTDPPPRMPDAIQIFSDPISPHEELLRICQEHGIEFVSYSTLGTQHRGRAQNPVLTSPIVTGLAQKHNRSTAEVVLCWALQRGMSVIPRSSKRAHIHELARLLKDDSCFLDSADLAQIDSMKNTL